MSSWAEKARKATPQHDPASSARALFYSDDGGHYGTPTTTDDSMTMDMLPISAEAEAVAALSSGGVGVSNTSFSSARMRGGKMVQIDDKSHFVAPGTGYFKSTVRAISGDIWASKILVFSEYADVLRVGLCCHVLYDAARRETLWCSVEESYLRQYCILTGREEPPQPSFLLPPQCSSLIKGSDRGGGSRSGRSSVSGSATPSSQARSATNTPKIGPTGPLTTGSESRIAGAGGLNTGYVVRGSGEGDDGALSSPIPDSSLNPIPCTPPIAPRGCTIDRALARDFRILKFIRLARFLVGDLQRQWHLQNLARESWLFKRVAQVVAASRSHAAGRGNALLRVRGYVPVEFEPFISDVLVAEINQHNSDDDEGAQERRRRVTRPPIQHPSRRDNATERRLAADAQRIVEAADQEDAMRREDEELAARSNNRHINEPLFYEAYDVEEYEEEEHEEDDEVETPHYPIDVAPIPVHMYTILRPDGVRNINPSAIQSVLDSITNGIPSRTEYFDTTEANPTMYMITLSQVLRRLHGGGFTAVGVRGSLTGPRFSARAHLVELTREEATSLVLDTFQNLEMSVSTYHAHRGGAPRVGVTPTSLLNRAGDGNSSDDPNALKTMARLLVDSELTVDAAETRYFASPQIYSTTRGMGLVVVDPLLMSVFYP